MAFHKLYRVVHRNTGYHDYMKEFNDIMLPERAEARSARGKAVMRRWAMVQGLIAHMNSQTGGFYSNIK